MKGPGTPFDAAWCGSRRHQPFFCEENVLHLLHAPGLPAERAVVFVTNVARAVAMWGQRAAAVDPVVWDYHVVLLLPTVRTIVDLDDREHAARPVHEWLARAFRPDTADALQPRFRVVHAAEFLATFSSDRSHMRDGRGAPLRPFPSWPAPYDPRLGHTLPRFLDLDDTIAGTVTDAAGLLREWGAA